MIREFSKLPILILSALDSPGLVAAALDAGADDYLIKPVRAMCSWPTSTSWYGAISAGIGPGLFIGAQANWHLINKI